MRPLLWVSKSHDKLAVAMRTMGHKISTISVKRLLPTLGFVAAQFAGQPVISVDTNSTSKATSSILNGITRSAHAQPPIGAVNLADVPRRGHRAK